MAGRILNLLHKLESGLLALLLLLMICLAAYQVLARNFFDSGLTWGDGFVRVAVLWVTLIGAMVASRTDEHIRMDVLTRFLSPVWRPRVRRLGALFTALICGLVAWHCAQFVLMEMEYPSAAFGEVPAWVCELILPVGFGIIALRYLLHTLLGVPDNDEPEIEE